MWKWSAQYLDCCSSGGRRCHTRRTRYDAEENRRTKDYVWRILMLTMQKVDHDAEGKCRRNEVMADDVADADVRR